MIPNAIMLAEAVAPSYSTFSTVITDSFSTMVNETLSLAAGIMPLAITVFGVMLLIKKGKQIFGAVTGK